MVKAAVFFILVGSYMDTTYIIKICNLTTCVIVTEHRNSKNCHNSCCIYIYWIIFSCHTCNQQGKRGHCARALTHRHARTLPNTEALGPEIEEGAVNRRPLQELFPLPWGGARPAAGPGAILLQSTNYARVVISSKN